MFETKALLLFLYTKIYEFVFFVGYRGQRGILDLILCIIFHVICGYLVYKGLTAEDKKFSFWGLALFQIVLLVTVREAFLAVLEVEGHPVLHTRIIPVIIISLIYIIVQRRKLPSILYELAISVCFSAGMLRGLKWYGTHSGYIRFLPCFPLNLSYMFTDLFRKLSLTHDIYFNVVLLLVLIIALLLGSYFSLKKAVVETAQDTEYWREGIRWTKERFVFWVLPVLMLLLPIPLTWIYDPDYFIPAFLYVFGAYQVIAYGFFSGHIFNRSYKRLMYFLLGILCWGILCFLYFTPGYQEILTSAIDSLMRSLAQGITRDSHTVYASIPFALVFLIGCCIFSVKLQKPFWNSGHPQKGMIVFRWTVPCYSFLVTSFLMMIIWEVMPNTVGELDIIRKWIPEKNGHLSGWILFFMLLSGTVFFRNMFLLFTKEKTAFSKVYRKLYLLTACEWIEICLFSEALVTVIAIVIIILSIAIPIVLGIALLEQNYSSTGNTDSDIFDEYIYIGNEKCKIHEDFFDCHCVDSQGHIVHLQKTADGYKDDEGGYYEKRDDSYSKVD